MAPRETENNAYAKFWGDKQRTLWYVMVFSGVVNIAKSQKTVLWRFVHLHKIVHSRKPTLTGFFKRSQRSNKTANIGAKSCKHHAHTECSKNYKILLLVTLTSILTRKGSNDRLGRPHFGSNSPLYRQNCGQMAGVCTGRGGRMGGIGIDCYIIIVI